MGGLGMRLGLQRFCGGEGGGSQSYFPVAGTRIALVGDSLTAANDGGWEKSGSTLVGSLGYFNWGRAFSQRKNSLMAQYAVSGGTTAIVLSGISAVAEREDIDLVILLVATNDIAADRTLENIKADYTSIVESLSPKAILAMTIPPRYADTQPHIELRAEVNEWISKLPTKHKNLRVLDIHAILSDEAGSIFSQELLSDSVHFSFVGAMLVGNYLAETLKEILPFEDEFIPTESSDLCVLPNASMTIPFAATACTVVYSDSIEFPGRKKAVITPSSTTSSEIKHAEVNISGGRYAAGDKLQGIVDIEWNIETFDGSANSFGPQISFMPRRVNNTTLTRRYSMFTSSGEYKPLANCLKQGRAIFKTPIYTVDADINRIYPSIEIRGVVSGTITVHRLSIVKVD